MKPFAFSSVNILFCFVLFAFGRSPVVGLYGNWLTVFP